jgi:hypothetical protein
VFFQTNGIKWSYEPNAFRIVRINYLPDFHLPLHNIFIEIKPKDSQLADYLACELAILTDSSCVLLIGDPFPFEYEAVLYTTELSRALPITIWRGGQLAKCRRCDGICFVGNPDLEGGLDWCELGPHTCGDHDRKPLVFGEEAFKSARSMRFHG